MYGQRVEAPNSMFIGDDGAGVNKEQKDKFNNYYGNYMLSQDSKNHSRVFNHVDPGLN